MPHLFPPTLLGRLLRAQSRYFIASFRIFCQLLMRVSVYILLTNFERM